MKSRVLMTLAMMMAVFVGSAHSQTQTHQRLRMTNTFTQPEEVVAYYCARDASGFVWSGLLEAERRAFTTWQQAPSAENFYVAKDYTILPVAPRKAAPDTAEIEVKYDLVGMSDPYGSLVPDAPKPHRVVFQLKKMQGHWKIVKPEPKDISPVVLQSKFPVLGMQ